MMDFNILVVAGVFDDKGGRKSGYAAKLFVPGDHLVLVNGGYWSELPIALQNLDRFAAVVWMPDVPNDRPKLAGTIKEKLPHIMLITSKNNLENRYSPLEIVGRALKTKSNLLLEFTKSSGLIEATIWDALGNVFLHKSTDTEYTGKVLMDRLGFLAKMTRVRSKRIGDALEVPDESRFFEIARSYAEVFHQLVHAVNPDRFLGNVCFRCENGFPSFRDGNLIYVSRRNVDKRSIGKDAFVAVNADALDPVEYYGEQKPSVDTPIQVRLFQQFPKIRYMLHSHVYLVGALTTKRIIPCGAVEEVQEIMESMGERYQELMEDGHVEPEGFRLSRLRGWAINLRGHGSIIATDNLDHLNHLPYVSRPLPEIANEA